MIKPNNMNRRKFLTAATAVGAAGVSMPYVHAQEKRKWRMVTTWPKNFPGLGTGANKIAEYITKASDGRLTVTVYGGGEIVPPFESFDAVSEGTAEMGHGAAYYWKGKSPATQFFTAVPFGMTAQEINGWVYHGGGQQLWDDLYAKFNLKPFLGGNTGVQMGGWFNREINSLDDLKGLKIRMPGLGGEVLNAAGATAKVLPGGEIFTALQTGAIDATEWVGPYNDLAFGLHKVAKFYYYPGWHEPGAALECFVNKQAYDALPADLQQIVAVACQAGNNNMLGEYTARNGNSLDTLVNKHGVQLKRFPDDVVSKLRTISEQVVGNVAAGDAESRKIYDNFKAFLNNAGRWTTLSETYYTQARGI